MNMQAIQIAILLLDTFKLLVPWQTVTDAMDRIACGAGECLARGFSGALAASACLGALPVIQIFEPLPVTGYFVGMISSHIVSGNPVFDQIMFAFGFAVALSTGLWWCDRSARIDSAT